MQRKVGKISLSGEGGGAGAGDEFQWVESVIFNFEATAKFDSAWYRTNILEVTEQYNKIFLNYSGLVTKFRNRI